MAITLHKNIIQGSEEWHAIRCGILTASEMKLIITPTLKAASNDKEKTHLFELAAQRVNKYVEPSYISDSMLRGHDDEIQARILYSQNFAEVEEVGFITNNNLGFTIGYSPDGLVGDDGLIECKSRCQKYQFETIIKQEVPSEYVLQLQTGLLVSGRKWIDYVSYCAGMPMFVKRVYPDDAIISAIKEASDAFEARISAALKTYENWVFDQKILIETERTQEEEMMI
jgi:hypothetical protein